MLLTAIPFSLLFCAIIALASRILSIGTVLFFGTPPLCGLIPGLACGVFGYILFQKPILQVLKRQKELDFVEMLDHHPKIKKLAAIIFALVLVGSMAFCIGLPLMGARFYEDHAVISIEGIWDQRVEYDQVRQIYYIQGRYNDYGDLIHRPSYVILLQDGTAVDLDCTASLKEQKEVIETVFCNFAVTTLESDRDLP